MKAISSSLEALLVTGGMYLAHIALGMKSGEQVSNIAGTFAAVSGTLMGFLVAALSILTSLIHRRLIENMRKTGHWDYLLRRIYKAASAFLVVLVLSLMVLFIMGPWKHWLMVTASGLMLLAIWQLVSAGKTLQKVFKALR